MELTRLDEALDSITDLEEIVDDVPRQAELLTEAIEALEQAPDEDLSRHLPAVLRMFERCGYRDDFGMFETLISIFERLSDDPASRELVQRSVRSRPTWPTLRLLPAFATTSEARSILEDVIREGSFRDPRYRADWLHERLAELG